MLMIMHALCVHNDWSKTAVEVLWGLPSLDGLAYSPTTITTVVMKAMPGVHACAAHKRMHAL